MIFDRLRRHTNIREDIVACRVAGDEIGIAQAQRGCDQSAYIHLRSRAKQHATGIQHKHLAIGIEAAEDGSGTSANNTV